MTVHEVLVRARNLIERGWCQRSARRRDPPGPFAMSLPPLERCSIGAVCDVSAPTEEQVSALEALMQVVGQAVISWNDAPGRTKAEVLAAFDEAIRRTAPAPEDPFVGAAQGTDVAEGRAAEQVGALS